MINIIGIRTRMPVLSFSPHLMSYVFSFISSLEWIACSASLHETQFITILRFHRFTKLPILLTLNTPTQKIEYFIRNNSYQYGIYAFPFRISARDVISSNTNSHQNLNKVYMREYVKAEAPINLTSTVQTKR